MKKAKIFLGVACLTVAIGAAAFTKANSKLAAPEYYFFTPSSGPDQCVLLDPVSGCADVSGDCIINVSSSQQNKQIFTESTCTTHLKKS